jgi:cytochrome c553
MGTIMNINNGIFAFRARIFFVLLMVFPLAAHSESIMVGDIEINPQDFSAKLDSEQRIARQGISQRGVPACVTCHGLLGGGSAVGPRLAGQNLMYIQNQFKAFASGSRKTIQSAAMQPVVASLTDEDIKAVAHYYKQLIKNFGHKEHAAE